MNLNSRGVFLVLGPACALSLLSACSSGPASQTQLLPSQVVAPASSAARKGGELLYATTLDWNTGAGTVYYYHAYGSDTSALGSLAINPGYPNGVWTDRKGNVYVAVVNAGSNGRGYVNVYTPKLGKLLRTYAAGLDGPSGGTFDAAGNMYVSNVCGTAPSISCYVFARRHGHPDTGRNQGSLNGYVAVFPPGSTQPSKYLQTPINIAVGVALDARENVFAANNTGGYAWNVVKFAAGTSTGHVVPFRRVPYNRWVGAVAFDPNDELVASVNSTIDFWPRERGKPAHKLTHGVVAADGLAYGPDGTLFAGNYEFEQNEGNVIAFPPGATAPARTFAVPYNNGVISVAVGGSGK